MLLDLFCCLYSICECKFLFFSVQPVLERFWAGIPLPEGETTKTVNKRQVSAQISLEFKASS